jgi:protocatechuate 3,4-dioxygenase, alpha subunit
LSLTATTSQTVGPFFRIGLDRLNCADIAPQGVPGERVIIQGRVLDGDGVAVPDAVIEIWQANSAGKYGHPDDRQEKPTHARFKGYGRISTSDDGRYCFRTIKPGSVPGPNGTTQAPHLVASVFMRGLLKRLVTRMYFPADSSQANDPVLGLVPMERRPTLIAAEDTKDKGSLRWDIILQGPLETVFFDF